MFHRRAKPEGTLFCFIHWKGITEGILSLFIQWQCQLVSYRKCIMFCSLHYGHPRGHIITVIHWKEILEKTIMFYVLERHPSWLFIVFCALKVLQGGYFFLFYPLRGYPKGLCVSFSLPPVHQCLLSNVWPRECIGYAPYCVG